ncbi:MAG TPA: hypothetical protein P5340_03350 [Defluviicoccus sp.]|nr:hypothetical protein [Defluviicoccus sp.]
MLYEYAVEPAAIAESWGTFRYLIEKFGFEQGRLIAQFPKNWKKMVYEAAGHLPDGENKKRIEVRLQQLSDGVFLRSGRPYRPERDWIGNAVAEHQRQPFRAVIAADNRPDGDGILHCSDVAHDHPLMVAAPDDRVPRTAEELGRAAAMLLGCSREIILVDRYFDPSATRFRNVLREFLRLAAAGGRQVSRCEYHFVDGQGNPACDAFKRECSTWLRNVIPPGWTVTFFRWREKPRGEDFHARYVLTDIGGLDINAGLDEAPGQTTDVRRMGSDVYQQRLKDFQRDADTYELVEPVLQVSASGYVERV